MSKHPATAILSTAVLGAVLALAACGGTPPKSTTTTRTQTTTEDDTGERTRSDLKIVKTEQPDGTETTTTTQNTQHTTPPAPIPANAPGSH